MSDTTNEDVQKLVEGLCMQQKLLRDRGILHLKTALPSLSKAATISFVDNLLLIVENRNR